MRVIVATIVHDPEDARIFHRQIGALLAALAIRSCIWHLQASDIISPSLVSESGRSVEHTVVIG